MSLSVLRDVRVLRGMFFCQNWVGRKFSKYIYTYRFWNICKHVLFPLVEHFLIHIAAAGFYWMNLIKLENSTNNTNIIHFFLIPRENVCGHGNLKMFSTPQPPGITLCTSAHNIISTTAKHNFQCILWNLWLEGKTVHCDIYAKPCWKRQRGVC